VDIDGKKGISLGKGICYIIFEILAERKNWVLLNPRGGLKFHGDQPEAGSTTLEKQTTCAPSRQWRVELKVKRKEGIFGVGKEGTPPGGGRGLYMRSRSLRLKRPTRTRDSAIKERLVESKWGEKNFEKKIGGQLRLWRKST